MTVERVITDHMDLWTGAITKKSSSGRGSGGKRELTGIKKLRELILELAVRGKLVGQNANDERAEVSLARMLVEKEQLIQQGQLKRTKPVTSPDQFDKPFDLPDGWTWATLPMISGYSPGKTPPTKNARFWANGAEGHAWISIADMEHYGEVLQTARRVSDEAATEVFKYDPVAPGAILMSFKLTVGKVAINRVPAYHNEAIISIFPMSEMDKSFLFKVLPMLAALGNAKSAIKGNTLNAQSIAGILVPVPPLAEQHRIVQKVDELMALCDQLEQQTGDQIEAHERLVDTLLETLTRAAKATELAENWARVQQHFDTLFTTEHSIDRLKQTILQLAVIGRLVPQNSAERSAEISLQETEGARSVLLKKARKKVRSQEVSSIQNDMPKGWASVPVAELFELQNGYAFKSSWFVKSGVKLLRNVNIQHGKLNWDDAARLPIERIAEFERFKLNAGDIVLSLDRPIISAGLKYALVRDEDLPSLLLQRVARFKDVGGCVDARYLEVWLNSSQFIGSIDPGRSNGVPHISTGEIGALNFPLPPIAEQERIAESVEAMLEICDSLCRGIQRQDGIPAHLADALVDQAIQ